MAQTQPAGASHHGNALQPRAVFYSHVFEPVISRSAVQHRMMDGLAGLFGGRALPIVTHRIDCGKRCASLPRKDRRE